MEYGNSSATSRSLFRPRYHLSDRELLTLSHQLLAQRPPTGQDSLVCYMLDGRDTFSNLARHIEREVFLDKFGLDGKGMHRLYSKYEAELLPGAYETGCCSFFFLVMDQGRQGRPPVPVGALRVIRYPKPLLLSRTGSVNKDDDDKNRPSSSNPTGAPHILAAGPGLATLNDAASMSGISTAAFQSFHDVRDLHAVWDMGSMAVSKHYRNTSTLQSLQAGGVPAAVAEAHLPCNMLLRAVVARATHEGVTHLVCTLDVDLRRVVVDAAGWPFVPLLHGRRAMPCGRGGKWLDGASVAHEGSRDSMFLVMKLDDESLRAPERRAASLLAALRDGCGADDVDRWPRQQELEDVKNLHQPRGRDGSGDQRKQDLAAAARVAAVMARRILWGQGVDQRLVFDISKSPYATKLRGSPGREVARL
ncbi:hypothetical protein MN608_04458 [Microdochium nivale]|nr:hypothetical protein MN608_04458 [Microdochium nivale]